MKVVIIGGDAAGLKTAARLRRLQPDAEITVLDRGDIISYAGCGLPYFLSGDVDSFNELIQTAWGDVKDPQYFKDTKNLDVLINTEAIAIDKENKIVTAKNVDSGEETDYSYDYLVIATGASPKLLDIPGIENDGVTCFTRPEDAKALRQALQTGQVGKVAIIGAGYIGLELCEAFGALWGAEIVLLEREDHVLPMMLDKEVAHLVEKHLAAQDVDIKCGVAVKSIELAEEGLTVKYNDSEVVNVDRAIMAAGVAPNSSLAMNAGIEIGANGGILIDSTGKTSDDYIYAAGDCAEMPKGETSHLLPLGSIANRMGRVVANSIAGIKDEMPVLHGSAVVKVFDINVATCGASAEMLRKKGEDPEEYWGSFSEAAHYYPETHDIHLKIVRHKDGALAGIQAVGNGEVVRWINSFAQVLDLADGDPGAIKRVEHAYAPPFATAMDPLHHMAAMIEAGYDLQLSPDILENGGDESWTIVNMMNEEESAGWERPDINGTLLDIEYRQLLSRIDDLPRENVVLLCARGPRSYEATVMLRAKGINAKYIAGGITFS